MPNRSKTWAAILLAATFVAGIAVGSGVPALWGRWSAARSGRLHGLDRMMSELNHELHLTPVQRDSVRAILGRHFARMSAAWDSVRPRFDSMRSEMDSEVVRRLDAGQAAGYRDHVTRYRHQREQPHSDSGSTKR